MINKARRADNIIEWIIIGIVAIIFLNLFLGKVYDHFQETVASSKLNKMFQPEQTRFEPSSNANYADASSQINVPLVGEQGLTRYYNGSIRTINSLMNKDLAGNTVAQAHLAEAVAVLSEIRENNLYPQSPSEPTNLSSIGNSYFSVYQGDNYTQIGSFGAEDFLTINYDSCPTNFSNEQGKIDYIACIKSSFSKN